MAILTGRKNITKHLDLSWPTVKKLHRKQGLPIVLVGGKWALDTGRARQWMDRLYEQQTKHAS